MLQSSCCSSASLCSPTRWARALRAACYPVNSDTTDARSPLQRSTCPAFARHAVSKPPVSQREALQTAWPCEPLANEGRHADKAAARFTRGGIHRRRVAVGQDAPVLRACRLGISATGTCHQHGAHTMRPPMLANTHHARPLLTAGGLAGGCMVLALQSRNDVAVVLVCELARLFTQRALPQCARSAAWDAHGALARAPQPLLCLSVQLKILTCRPPSPFLCC